MLTLVEITNLHHIPFIPYTIYRHERCDMAHCNWVFEVDFSTFFSISQLQITMKLRLFLKKTADIYTKLEILTPTSPRSGHPSKLADTINIDDNDDSQIHPVTPKKSGHSPIESEAEASILIIEVGRKRIGKSDFHW